MLDLAYDLGNDQVSTPYTSTPLSRTCSPNHRTVPPQKAKLPRGPRGDSKISKTLNSQKNEALQRHVERLIKAWASISGGSVLATSAASQVPKPKGAVPGITPQAASKLAEHKDAHCGPMQLRTYEPFNSVLHPLRQAKAKS